MLVLRACWRIVIGLLLVNSPALASTPGTAPLGTVIASQRGHIGGTAVDVGTTVYGGDKLSTDGEGTMQVRAGAARLLLMSSSTAIVDDDEGVPSAKLILGTATFSTGNAHAFVLFVSKAAIRPETDAPTIGTVTYVNEKALVVTARRGGLVVTVEDETQVISEGQSFRVLLDPSEVAAQGPEGAGGTGKQGQIGGHPIKAGRSRFLLITTALIGAGTGVAIYKALESPSRP